MCSKQIVTLSIFLPCWSKVYNHLSDEEQALSTISIAHGRLFSKIETQKQQPGIASQENALKIRNMGRVLAPYSRSVSYKRSRKSMTMRYLSRLPTYKFSTKSWIHSLS